MNMYKSTKQMKENLENIKLVIDENDVEVPAVVSVDPVTADAYISNVKAEENLDEMEKELEEKAEEAFEDVEPVFGETIENMYTAPLKLDESLEDFKLVEARERVAARDENDSDKYLEYDMFEFTHELLAAGSKGITNIAPKTPTVWRKKVRYVKDSEGNRVPGKVEWGWFPMQKFMPAGSDDASYGGTNEGAGVPQIGSNFDGDIFVYSNDIDDLKQAQQGLDMYKIKYEEPQTKLSSTRHWNFSMKVIVPKYDDGEVMLLEDYLDEIGMDMEDVMPPNFVKTYEKKSNKAKKAGDEIIIQFVFPQFGILHLVG